MVQREETSSQVGSSGILQIEPKAHRLPLQNLLNDLECLASNLGRAAADFQVLNSFLLIAGMEQIVEDYIDLGASPTDRIVRKLAAASYPGRGLLRLAASIRQDNRQSVGGEVCSQLRLLIEPFAEWVMGGPQPETAHWQQVLETVQKIRLAVSKLPDVMRRSVIRLPSCFLSFDQHPDDLHDIVERFAACYSDLDRAVVVVGLRSSGSYLAPLMAAAARKRGFQHTTWTTLRPGHPPAAAVSSILSAASRGNAIALIVDDPPSTGSSMARGARMLERIGFPSESIVITAALFVDMPALPDSLAPWASVTLPFSDWSIHRRIAPDTALFTSSSLACVSANVTVDRVPEGTTQPGRGHLRAVYKLALINNETGAASTRQVVGNGTGLGYFGDYALAVNSAVADFLPRQYGGRDGVAYSEFEEDDSGAAHVKDLSNPALARNIAKYVFTRAIRMQTPEDVSMRLDDREPIWQHASDLITQAFGGAGRIVRPVIHATARTILAVDRPAIIDGAMSLTNWRHLSNGSYAKLNAADGAFSNQDRSCYDPVYDLACAAASAQDADFAASLRSAYQEISGKAVDPTVWFLYRALYLRHAERSACDGRTDWNHLTGEVFREFVQETLFPERTPPETGGLCAIDIDGVLENGRLGFTAISPLGAASIRALTAHGFRPILVTGRSIEDVRGRCDAYNLAGGVAEYGSSLYVRATNSSMSLLSRQEKLAMHRLRTLLCQQKGVYLDPLYQDAVRAYQFDEYGNRRFLDQETTSAMLSSEGLQGEIRPIEGMRQTDFTVTGVNKSTGLRSLHSALAGNDATRSDKPVRLAVGDTHSDLPMFELAQAAFAPANADDEVRKAGISLTRRPYQAGLAEAVTRTIGHAPGSCRQCRRPALAPRSALLLQALGAQDAGKLGKLVCAWRLKRRLAHFQ